jgi:hypothetical protein
MAHEQISSSPSGPPVASHADPTSPELPATRAHSTWQPTRAGGLFFLLPLLARLGIAGQLDAQPELREIGLPRRLLRDIADRLGVPADDPAVLALDPPDWPDELLPRCPFVAPSTWADGLAHRGQWVVRPVGGSPGRRVLLDGAGLPVTVWYGRAPAAVRSLLSARAPLAPDRPDAANPRPLLRGGTALRPRSDVDIVLTAWRVAIRRWCRRYADLMLRALIVRPAWVAATPTHLDVRFHHRQAEASVRTAGLDLDPGWVPWFGRVVLFHYRDELPAQTAPRDGSAPLPASWSLSDDDA